MTLLRPRIELGIVIVFVLQTIFVAGCRRDEPISVQHVPKSRSGLEALRERESETTATSTTDSNVFTGEPSDRMVVGMYALDDATWFFKINGPIEDVKKAEPQWRPFLKSVEFEEGKPKYELPKGWTEGPDRPMRFATLKLGDFEPPLEMAISPLGPGQDVLLNVNRWRGQMGLPPVSDAELDTCTSKLESDANSAILFDVAGRFSGGMRAPFAGGGHPPFAGPMTRPPAASETTSAPSGTDKSGFDFDIPEDWESGRTSSMVPVRLTKKDEEKTAEITVVGLPASANKWEPNVERWAGQVGLTELTDADYESRTQEIKVDGVTGKMVTLIPKQGERALIAGMVKRDGRAWFLKLAGDKSVVEDSQEIFDTFVTTLKFP